MVTLSVTYKGVPDLGCSTSAAAGVGKDEKIEKLIGKECGGSGFFFGDGVRDMSFSFRSDADAKKALSRFNRGKKKLRIAGLKAEIIERPVS